MRSGLVDYKHFLKARDGEKLDAVHVTSKDNGQKLLSNSGLHGNSRKKLLCYCIRTGSGAGKIHTDLNKKFPTEMERNY